MLSESQIRMARSDFCAEFRTVQGVMQRFGEGAFLTERVYVERGAGQHTDVTAVFSRCHGYVAIIGMPSDMITQAYSNSIAQGQSEDTAIEYHVVDARNIIIQYIAQGMGIGASLDTRLSLSLIHRPGVAIIQRLLVCRQALDVFMRAGSTTASGVHDSNISSQDCRFCVCILAAYSALATDELVRYYDIPGDAVNNMRSVVSDALLAQDVAMFTGYVLDIMSGMPRFSHLHDLHKDAQRFLKDAVWEMHRMAGGSMHKNTYRSLGPAISEYLLDGPAADLLSGTQSIVAHDTGLLDRVANLYTNGRFRYVNKLFCAYTTVGFCAHTLATHHDVSACPIELTGVYRACQSPALDSFVFRYIV